MTLNEFKELMIQGIMEVLFESGPRYMNSATPNTHDNILYVGRNPLATDHGNHGGSLDATSTPSTIDWDGERFGADEVIPLSDNAYMTYKIKNFGTPDRKSTADFFGNDNALVNAIHTLYGAGRRNGKRVKFRVFIPASNPPKKNSMIRTFWEYSFDNGKTWYIMKPNPTQSMKPSKYGK